MDMTQTDRPGSNAIDSYLGRADSAARDLPPDRRVELLDQLREHLDAVSSAPDATEATVLAAIDRLGEPAEIVGSEQDSAVARVATDAALRSGWGALEILAVILLIVGPFIAPVVGPVAGLVCAWLSPTWTRGEKWVATVLASGPILLFTFLFIAVFI